MRIFATTRRAILAALAASLTLLAAPPLQTALAASQTPVGAESGMVVSAHRLASEVGVDVLKRGGTAVDAAVAVAYALAVVYPEAGNLGGGGFMTIRLADGRETFIDFRETAPLAATRTMYLDKAGNVVPGLSTRAHLAVAVPGTVAGLELARAKYGTWRRADLVRPAIRLAERGFILDQGDAELLAEGAPDFAKDGPTRAIFLNKDGRPFEAGDRLVQADLARMLRIIAKDGAEGFYRGEPARLIAAASQANGGILTVEDFARYEAVERRPISCGYRGYRILSAPPPSSGGLVLCQSLAILEGYPMAEYGFHSASSVHVLTEALRRAFRDRNTRLGDPKFVPVDIAPLISAEYAATLRAGISLDRATPSASLGGVGAGKEGRNTTHFSIVDAQGSAVSLTYTLNDWFGARVTAAGTGILLNNEMDDFSAKAGAPNMYGLVEGENNAIAPGKRPLSSMSPTIVTRDGKLALVVGTPGGSHIPTAVLQVLVNMVDYGMTVTEAVDAPRIHAQWLPDAIFLEPRTLSAETRAALTAKGHKLEDMDYWNHVAAIAVGAPKFGGAQRGRFKLYGAIDPRQPVGAVDGY
ncbi:MAG: gamma-glutamyltransferase [Alphaproteobacteria bacterium]|nr:gamma-glutamyltransferase [Alphaproteobacteria bacterium]